MRTTTTSFATLALIVLGCLGLAACSSSVATPAAPKLTAAQILSKAQAASPKAATYADDISTTTAAGKTTDLKTKISYTSTPKRIHTVLSTTDAGKTTTLETIQDDQNSYVNFGGTWMKTPTTTPVDISALDLTKSLYTSIQNPTLVGVETVNGVAAYHLTATASQGLAAGESGKADFWVRQDNYYPVRLAAKSSGGTQGAVNFTVDYTAWDDQVKIDLPNV